MTQQPEALRLSAEFENAWSDVEPCVQAAAELRRLHEENETAKRLIAKLSEVINAQYDRITTLEAALRQAVEALEAALSHDKPYIDRSKEAITSAKQALGEQV